MKEYYLVKIDKIDKDTYASAYHAELNEKVWVPLFLETLDNDSVALVSEGEYEKSKREFSMDSVEGRRDSDEIFMGIFIHIMNDRELWHFFTALEFKFYFIEKTTSKEVHSIGVGGESISSTKFRVMYESEVLTPLEFLAKYHKAFRGYLNQDSISKQSAKIRNSYGSTLNLALDTINSDKGERNLLDMIKEFMDKLGTSVRS